MFKECSFSSRILTSLCVFSIFIQIGFSQNIGEESLIKLSLEDRIRHYGYPVETYQVTTEDGYMPSLYRIPHKIGENLNDTKNKSVVLLLHGMAGSPKNFFLLGNESVGFGLVEQNFDVWVFCARGMECGHKQKHKNLDWDKNRTYWQYTLHELGFYDLPAAIDFVLNKTLQEKIFLVGHSAGSTMLFILLSERPEYNEKVKIAVSYAATVFLSQSDYPFLRFASSIANIGKGIWFNILNLYEFLPRGINDMFVDFINAAAHDPLYSNIFRKGVGIVGSHTSVLIDHKRYVQFILNDASYRVSAMQVFHYTDIINSGNFMKYDHGWSKNFQIYGQHTPPNYNLTKVTCPTAFYYGANDEIASITDVRRTMSHLPNVVEDYLIPFKKFTHIDFIFAQNASKFLYEPTYKLFKNFDNGILPERRKRQSRRRVVHRKRW